MSDSDTTDDDSTGLAELFGDDGDAPADIAAAEDREAEPDEKVVHTVDIDMDGPVGIYDHQRHRGGDETVILLCAFGDGYQAIAIDVDAGGQILATEEIGDAADDARAASQVEYWRDQNPKGILGGDPDDGGGLLDMLTGGGSK